MFCLCRLSLAFPLFCWFVIQHESLTKCRCITLHFHPSELWAKWRFLYKLQSFRYSVIATKHILIQEYFNCKLCAVKKIGNTRKQQEILRERKVTQLWDQEPFPDGKARARTRSPFWRQKSLYPPSLYLYSCRFLSFTFSLHSLNPNPYL